ncbi:MAG: aspartate dehydrogenase domain-containing protein [Rhodobacterales bacterium]
MRRGRVAHATGNLHEITASGAFGTMHLQINGQTLPDTPRSSALAAMSMLARVAAQCGAVVF